MSKIAVATDSNSGISQERAKKYGVFVLPMTFNIDGEDYMEGIGISHNEFFEKQAAGSKIFTSQPAPGAVIELWDKILEEYDEIVYIPMASSLSSSCSTAQMLAQDYEGKVFVVDNERVAVTEKQAVLDALSLIEAGKTAQEIQRELTFRKSDASIYMMVDDLKYLKAGGRISGAAAAMGTVLNIKPVLSVNDGKIEPKTKARGVRAAKKEIFAALEYDMENKYHCTDISKYTLYTCAALRRDEAIKWNEEVEEHFGAKCHIEAMPLSIATHVGIGTFGACVCLNI